MSTNPKSTALSALLENGEAAVMCGVVGSTAYGLATEHSDVDRLGIHIAPTEQILGMGGAEAASRTYASNAPDGTTHELGKFLRLALQANPTVLELLWLTDHQVGIPEIAEPIVANRRAFLSEPRVRGAFGGYATQQAKRLQRRNAEGKDGFASDLAKRTAKHARHCARLCLSGIQALETGELLVDVSHHREWLFEVGELAVNDIEGFVTEFERLRERLDGMPSDLPQEPDQQLVNDLLVDARRLML